MEGFSGEAPWKLMGIEPFSLLLAQGYPGHSRLRQVFFDWPGVSELAPRQDRSTVVPLLWIHSRDAAWGYNAGTQNIVLKYCINGKS